MDGRDFRGGCGGLRNIAGQNEEGNGMGMTSEQLAAWAAARAVLLNEYRAAGCCAGWLARLAGGRMVAEALGMFTSLEGMVFSAERGVPSLGAVRLVEAAVNLTYYGVYVDGEGSTFENWRRGGPAAFVGPARSAARAVLPRVYRVLALHGAEVELYVPAAARVQILAGGGGRVEVAELHGGAEVLRWDTGASRWRGVRGAGEAVEG